ncbi:unnamed protein product [Prorocentrum cordatum]|uniref:Uncharacterized protein n=1 Tax=Prorocentrum cordatum TaxID=2364126 RepID=A0ABN9YCI3_9DINO|nr:unnamed protein product [Polarella glacialis]
MLKRALARKLFEAKARVKKAEPAADISAKENQDKNQGLTKEEALLLDLVEIKALTKQGCVEQLSDLDRDGDKYELSEMISECDPEAEAVANSDFEGCFEHVNDETTASSTGGQSSQQGFKNKQKKQTNKNGSKKNDRMPSKHGVEGPPTPGLLCSLGGTSEKEQEKMEGALGSERTEGKGCVGTDVKVGVDEMVDSFEDLAQCTILDCALALEDDERKVGELPEAPAFTTSTSNAVERESLLAQQTEQAQVLPKMGVIDSATITPMVDHIDSLKKAAIGVVEKAAEEGVEQ